MFDDVKTSEGIPPNSLIILGKPDPVVLAPGQTEPTMEQMAKSYARTSAVITNIAIEPAAVEKITPEQKFGLDMPSARPEEWDEPLRPSPLMRALGYTAHPATCTHYRKRLYLGTTQWTCADCGVDL